MQSVINCRRRRVPGKSFTHAGPELLLLVPQVGVLGQLLDLAEVKGPPVFGESIIDTTRVVGSDVVLLGEVLLLLIELVMN